MGPLKELHMEFPINPKKKGSIWEGNRGTGRETTGLSVNSQGL